MNQTPMTVIRCLLHPLIGYRNVGTRLSSSEFEFGRQGRHLLESPQRPQQQLVAPFRWIKVTPLRFRRTRKKNLYYKDRGEIAFVEFVGAFRWRFFLLFPASAPPPLAFPRNHMSYTRVIPIYYSHFTSALDDIPRPLVISFLGCWIVSSDSCSSRLSFDPLYLSSSPPLALPIYTIQTSVYGKDGLLQREGAQGGSEVPWFHRRCCPPG